MRALFDKDDYPNRPRILFIGLGDSSHTHSWIDLLEGAPFNVRLFCTSNALPPPDWKVRTYVTSCDGPPLDKAARSYLFDTGKVNRLIQRTAARVMKHEVDSQRPAMEKLYGVLQDWRPQVIHTLGLDAAFFYRRMQKEFGYTSEAQWILQTRGGSDLQLAHLDPERKIEIGPVLQACDQLLSDNSENFRIARNMGVREEQLSKIGVVPGTGGIDIEMMSSRWQGKPSARRIILWPKVYECPWSKALPVYEALKLCWDRIQPCELHLLAMTEEARMYYWTLPENIRRSCRVRDRVPRAETLQAMTQARVMLAPSLVDGTPNSMFEAMAAGALPIVSPLETIRAVVEDEENVLFARNLYPHEIAEALVRAMTDDALVDRCAENNLRLVRRLANRAEIRKRVVGFYEELAKSVTE